MYYRETDAGAANIADYTKDSYGASLAFGVPVSEYDTVRYGGRYEHTKLNVDSETSPEILDFCADSSEDIYDCQFDTYSLELGWSHDTRDRAIFPNKGGSLSLSGDIAIPNGDNTLSFYKVRLNKKHFFPLLDHLTLGVEGEAAYADVYGDSTVLAPYERYFAGGISTVRGYTTNSLSSTPGTRDSYGDPLGGNARLLGNLEFIFPPPWDLENNSMRLKAFVDAGNVYDTYDSVDMDQLRLSTGLSLAWLTPVGPLTFSYAQALNAEDGDKTENFQFTLGTP
jgi:outer membrane protein insertion porin family